MNPQKLLRASALTLSLLVPLSLANAQQLTLTGRILTRDFSQTSIPRFNIKLYPPKETGKAILATTTDVYGKFRFTGLSPSSYLLEVYLGKDLVYQEVVNLRTSIDRQVDLRRNSRLPPSSSRNSRRRQ
jgi:hypothetical protein